MYLIDEPPTLCTTYRNNLLYILLSEKAMFEHWDFNIVMACTPPPGYSSIKIWLYASRYEYKRLQVTCLA